MVTKDSIEAAYCFFHQKLRVYEYSTSPTQRDDIEYAISQYVESMSTELYQLLTDGQPHYLQDHTRFEQDLRAAVSQLETLI